MNTIEIWSPRFYDQKVLIKAFQLQPGMNRIVFTKSRAWANKELLMDADRIRSYPIEAHGRTGVYAVPLSDFEIKLLSPSGQTALPV